MEEGKGMENLEINEDNYKLYQKLLQIRDSRIDPRYAELAHVVSLMGLMIITIIAILGMITATHLAVIFGDKFGILFSIEERIIHTGVIGCYALSIIGIGYSIPKIICHIRTKRLHKKHPNVDIKASTEEIEKELEKYRQLSKRPKDIEKKEEEHLSQVPEDIEEKIKTHLSKYSSEFQEKTTEERLECLKQEQEFWKQVAIQEKYQDDGENTTGQTGVGQVNSSKEDKNKVYHI